LQTRQIGEDIVFQGHIVADDDQIGDLRTDPWKPTQLCKATAIYNCSLAALTGFWICDDI